MNNKTYGLTVTSIRKYGFKKALEVFDKYEHKCSVCGDDNYLAIHHVDGNGSHNEEKGIPTNDDISNLQLICRKCHGSIHGKQYWSKIAELRGGYLWKDRVKEYEKEYRQTDKNKEWRKKYWQSEKYKEYRKKYYQLKKTKESK